MTGGRGRDGARNGRLLTRAAPITRGQVSRVWSLPEPGHRALARHRACPQRLAHTPAIYLLTRARQVERRDPPPRSADR